MQRLITIVMAGLSVAIVITLGSVAWQVATVHPAAPRIETADEAIGYAFYAGLNRLLADGNRDDLDRLVSGDFVDHAGGTATDRSLDELANQLTSFGQTFPGIQIQPIELYPSGNNLIAELPPVTTPQIPLAGLELAPIRLNGGIDVLRIRRGKVSERWAAPLPPLAATNFEAASHSYSEGGSFSARLFSIEIPPGGQLSWPVDDVSLVMVQAGALALTTHETDELGAPVTQNETIEAGTARRLRPDAPIRLKSASDQGARLLLFAADRVDPKAPAPFHLEGGAKSKLIWNRNKPFELSAPWRLEAGRLLVPAYDVMSLGNPSAAEVLLATLDGPLTMTVASGTISHLDETYLMSPLDSPADLAPGAAAQLSGVDNAVLHAAAAGGSVVWLVTIDSILPDGVENGALTPLTNRRGPRR